MPIDCASRRAGSMVSTTTLRPRSAARSARAADVVVLPTPPEPQQTMMPGAGVVEQGVDVEGRGAHARMEASGPTRGRVRVIGSSCHALGLEQGGELVERAEVDARRQPGQLVRRDVEAADQLALRVLERAPLGVVAGLGEQRRRRGRRRPRSRRRAGRRRPPRGRGAPRRAAARSPPARSCGRTRLTTTPPTGRPCSRSWAIPSAVSCTGISSSTVTRCTAVRGERNSVMMLSACRLIGPILASPASSLLTLRNWLIRPGRRGVEHDRVVLPSRALDAVPAGGLVDLAGEQHVAHARRDRWWRTR